MVDYTYADLYKQSSVDKQWKIEFDGGTITNKNIHAEQITLTENLCSETELRFGACETSCITFRISDLTTPLKGKWITVSQTLAGHTEEPFVFGRYKVNSDLLTNDRYYRDITAYDALFDVINADVADWYNKTLPTAESTMTLKDFRTSFLSNFGIEQEDVALPNDEMIVRRTVEPSSMSGKEVITAICELNGCFGHIGRDGVFRYIFLKKAESSGGLVPSKTLVPSKSLVPSSGASKVRAISAEEPIESKTFTSQEESEGYVIYSSYWNGSGFYNAPFQAFDGKTNTNWCTTGRSSMRGEYIGYDFGENVHNATITIDFNNVYSKASYYIQGKKNGSWENITDLIDNIPAGRQTVSYESGDVGYTAFRLFYESGVQNISYGINIFEIKITGFTGGDTPIPTPTKPNIIKRNEYLNCHYEDFTVKNIDKVQIRQQENDIGGIYPSTSVSRISDDEDDNTIKSKTFTSQEESEGYVIYSSYFSQGTYQRYPFYAFDNSMGTFWAMASSNYSVTNQYIGYDFKQDVSNADISITFYAYQADTTYCIQGKSGEEWVDITEHFYVHLQSTQTYTYHADGIYSAFRFFIVKGTATGTRGMNVYDFSITGERPKDNTYIVQGNFLAFGMSASEIGKVAENLYNTISTVSYRPFNATVQGNPCLEVGDSVLVETKYLDIESYVLSRRMTGLQSLRDSLVSNGKEEQKEKVNSVQTSIVQLLGKTNTLERNVEETKSTIEDVEKGLQTQITQNAESIELKVSKGDVSSEISQESDRITIEGNRFVLKAKNIEITEDGKLTADLLYANSGGNLAGFEISPNMLSRDVTEVLPKYNADDIDRVYSIIHYSVEPTEEDYEKYDIDGNGIITQDDYDAVSRISSGTDTNIYTGTIKIKSDSYRKTLEFKETSNQKRDGTQIGILGMYSPSIGCKTLSTSGLLFGKSAVRYYGPAQGQTFIKSIKTGSTIAQAENHTNYLVANWDTLSLWTDGEVTSYNAARYTTAMFACNASAEGTGETAAHVNGCSLNANGWNILFDRNVTEIFVNFIFFYFA